MDAAETSYMFDRSHSDHNDNNDDNSDSWYNDYKAVITMNRNYYHVSANIRKHSKMQSRYSIHQ